MADNNVVHLNKPEQNDPLQEVRREGARKLLATDFLLSVTRLLHAPLSQKWTPKIRQSLK